MKIQNEKVKTATTAMTKPYQTHSHYLCIIQIAKFVTRVKFRMKKSENTARSNLSSNALALLVHCSNSAQTC